MANPLLLLNTRPWRRSSTTSVRRVAVEVPTETPGSDAIFLVLRRMRLPIVLLIVLFAVAVVGLTLIPGVDGDGKPYHMSMFDAFYFMSYTATTIGFGELPHTFTTHQRLWVTFAIYSTVVGWAYSIGTLFALIQDNSFRQAIATQRFRRKVRHLLEPFYIVIGYGQSGRTLARRFDDEGQRFVLVDHQRGRLDTLSMADLVTEVPTLYGDVRNPAVLGLAGLGNPYCRGVLALGTEDQINLHVVMAVHLLTPDVPVMARSNSRVMTATMSDFEPLAIIDPFDRFGGYLVLALQHPSVFQLVTWLMSPHGSELPPLRTGLKDGPWVVYADSRFGTELADDLRAAGLDVRMVAPDGPNPDVSDVVGLVAGSESDTLNIAAASHARLAKPELFLAVRQQSTKAHPLLEAFSPDSVFVPSDVVVDEALARLASPTYWGFIEHLLSMVEEDATHVRDLLVERCGDRAPVIWKTTIDRHDAPAVMSWLGKHDLTFAQLLRDPDTREPLAAVPIALTRKSKVIYLPDFDEALKPGDSIIFAGRTKARGELRGNLFHDANLAFCSTGEQMASTWIWRKLRGK